MKYIVTVSPGRMEYVQGRLREYNFRIVRKISDYVIVDVRPEDIPKIRAIPGVVGVTEEKRYEVMVVPVEKKLKEFMRLASNPLTLPLAIRYSVEADRGKYYWVTSESRRVLEAHIAGDMGITGRGIKLAVLDTGIDPTIEDLIGISGESTVRGQIAPLDENGHGTHCASTAAGSGIGDARGYILGVAPRATVRAFKCLGYGIGAGTNESVLDAMNRAAKWGASIISMSLGSDIKPDETHNEEECPLCSMANKLSEEGIVLSIAAGNSGKGYASCPGMASGAITVGAINRELKIADFSSRGHPDYIRRRKPDVVAPGVNIHATTATASLIDNMQIMDGLRRACISGTSMSTPAISGLTALWLEYARREGIELTPADIKRVIREKGMRYDPDYGCGVPKFSWIL